MIFCGADSWHRMPVEGAEAIMRASPYSYLVSIQTREFSQSSSLAMARDAAKARLLTAERAGITAEINL
jgi:hypothetical protein